MFERIIDDVKESTGNALRLTSLAGAAVVAAFITLLFLCAAAFVLILQTYGLIPACLTGAAFFFLITLISVITYEVRRNAIRKRAEAAAKSAPRNVLADPMMVAAGLQVARAIGFKRLIPLLAIGGLALGLMASRQPTDDDPRED